MTLLLAEQRFENGRRPSDGPRRDFPAWILLIQSPCFQDQEGRSTGDLQEGCKVASFHLSERPPDNRRHKRYRRHVGIRRVVPWMIIVRGSDGFPRGIVQIV